MSYLRHVFWFLILIQVPFLNTNAQFSEQQNQDDSEVYEEIQFDESPTEVASYLGPDDDRSEQEDYEQFDAEEGYQQDSIQEDYQSEDLNLD